MTDRKELIIELLAQTLAPRLFKLFGVRPEEMGFPFGDSREDFEERIEKQFNSVEYWLGEGQKIAVAIVNILEAGGVSLETADVDAMRKASLKERPDFNERGENIGI